ncbi:Uncharacterised protein [BD1-7 clade bacterium]|uniref:Uncharacterized protein n=1 Tax=BD1-7 clade bacterium TaxID=2029982 RepID=A0A5S9QXV9_9GAMM|nr:Uncharacterised protein [BD1-7 clade bacterium]
MNKLVCVLVAGFLSGSLMADTIYTKEVGRLTIDASWVKFTLSSEMPAECTDFRLEASSLLAKNAYSMLLASKHANKPLRRIDYTLPTSPPSACRVKALAID